MKKTGVYRFEHFNLTVTDPTIKIIEVRNRVQEKTCHVDISLEVEQCEFILTLNGFSYIEDLDYTSLNSWIDEKISNHKL